MRVSAGIPRPIETSEPVGEGAIAQGRNRGAPPPPRTDAGRTASAGHHCHRDGDFPTRRIEADLRVMHENLRPMERFMLDNPSRAASVRPQYESQRSLFQQVHSAYRARTGHDFDPRCAGATTDARVPRWTPPHDDRNSRDYVV
jgi:hypothetical protein